MYLITHVQRPTLHVHAQMWYNYIYMYLMSHVQGPTLRVEAQLHVQTQMWYNYMYMFACETLCTCTLVQ